MWLRFSYSPLAPLLQLGSEDTTQLCSLNTLGNPKGTRKCSYGLGRPSPSSFWPHYRTQTAVTLHDKQAHATQTVVSCHMMSNNILTCGVFRFILTYRAKCCLIVRYEPKIVARCTCFQVLSQSEKAGCAFLNFSIHCNWYAPKVPMIMGQT